MCEACTAATATAAAAMYRKCKRVDCIGMLSGSSSRHIVCRVRVYSYCIWMNHAPAARICIYCRWNWLSLSAADNHYVLAVLAVRARASTNHGRLQPVSICIGILARFSENHCRRALDDVLPVCLCVCVHRAYVSWADRNDSESIYIYICRM